MNEAILVTGGASGIGLAVVEAALAEGWRTVVLDLPGEGVEPRRAIGVFGTGTGRPDVIVAAIMAGLSLQGAAVVIRKALEELRPTRTVTRPDASPILRP